MSDISEKLLKVLKKEVYKKQKRKLSSLIGKYVKRDGQVFYVVSIDGDKIKVSDTKTAFDQKLTISVKAFLGKAIEIVE